MKSSHLTILLTCMGTVLSIGVVAAGVWISYPTGHPAETKTFRAVSPEDFKVIRAEAIKFAHDNAAKGIAIHPGPEQSQIFELQCKSVSLFLVENGYEILLTSTPRLAERRAPAFQLLRERIHSQLTPEGRPFRPGPVTSEPSGFEAFMLKHRDGIDLADECR